MTKGLLLYTDNTMDEKLFAACQKTVLKCRGDMELVSVSQKPIDCGRNIVMDLPKREVLSMFKQILKGIEECKTDVIFLLENDLLYHPSHFDFTPTREDTFYYNRNFWNVSSIDGKAVYYLHNDLSEMCAYRPLLLKHFTKVVERVERDGWKRRYGFSPPGGLPPEEQVGRYETYMAASPDINIRHPNALTRQRMNKEQFRSPQSRRQWTESDSVPGWGKTLGRFDELLASI